VTGQTGAAALGGNLIERLKKKKKQTEQAAKFRMNELGHHPLFFIFPLVSMAPQSVSSSKRLWVFFSSIRRWIVAETVGAAGLNLLPTYSYPHPGRRMPEIFPNFHAWKLGSIFRLW
jgi:hypothetical protein